MPQVESRFIVDAPLNIVWDLAQDVEKLPDIIPDLDAVHVLERQQMSPIELRTVTEWHGRIKAFNRRIQWTEEDIWNTEEHTCRFWQIKGDFTEYRGEWSFKEEAGKTVAHLKIDYKFEVPLVGAMMQKVVQKLLQENSDNMLQCLRAEAERRAGQ